MRRRPSNAPRSIEGRAGAILERVRAIPEGLVSTYADIDPAAPRLVGRVLATIHEEVPWHRVVRADGVAPVGASQLERLRREGVPLRGGRVDLTKARYRHGGWDSAAHQPATPPPSGSWSARVTIRVEAVSSQTQETTSRTRNSITG